jgi:branched-chain amino acid aminotransferase
MEKKRNNTLVNTLLPSAVFETMRTYGGKVFALDEHLERLFRSAELLGIEPRHSQADILREIGYLPTESKVRVHLTAEKFSVQILPLPSVDQTIYTEGVEVCERIFERPFPRAKYETQIYEEILNAQGEYFETLFFSEEGFLREGNISNVFAVMNGKVVTPKNNILLGVTREKIIQLIRENDISFEEREISREELLKADEIFLTNTTKEIIPVRKWEEWERGEFKIATELRVLFS